VKDAVRSPRTAKALPIDAAFPEAQASLLSAREAFNKHLYRPNTYLHKWWARRSGTCFRHILKGLVTDPAATDYLAPGGLEGTTILDPMMGGGTTLHEGVRLGANVVGFDIDPIPVVQARASLSSMPVVRKQTAFDEFFQSLRASISRHFETTCPSCGQRSEFKYMLYGYRKKCACGEVLVVDSLTLREEPSGKDVRLCTRCGGTHGDCPCELGQGRARVVTKGQTVCADCGGRFVERLDLPFRERYLPVAVVGTCPEHGLFHKTPDGADIEATLRLNANTSQWRLSPRMFAVPKGPKSSDLRNRRIRHYWELFSGRQLLYIRESARLLKRMPPDMRELLGLLVSTSLDFNCLMCGYKGAGIRRPGAVRHVFAHHAYSFPYTALENNPVSLDGSSGTLLRLFDDRVKRGALWAAKPREPSLKTRGANAVWIEGETDSGHLCDTYDELRSTQKGVLVEQSDARQMPLPDESVDYVVTDPPYFDNVQYSDISHFFRVWLAQLLPGRAKWSYNPSMSAVAGDGRKNGDGYSAMMASIWSECRRVLRKPGRLVFTFHHWRPQAWIDITLSLSRAGARPVNVYVVEAENPSSVHIANLRALRHDCILVLSFDDAANHRRWKSLERIDTHSSEGFCRDCADVLGWLLSERADETVITRTWTELLREVRNGTNTD